MYNTVQRLQPNHVFGIYGLSDGFLFVFQLLRFLSAGLCNCSIWPFYFILSFLVKLNNDKGNIRYIFDIKHAYLRLFIMSMSCDRREDSILEIIPNEERYSWNVLPLKDKHVLGGIRDWTTSERHDFDSLRHGIKKE